MNILFTCAGRRNYLINYFKEALAGKGQVFASDMQRSAPAMADADKAFLVPSIYDPGYISALQQIIRENEVDAVISLNDLELPILSENRNAIESLGAKLIVSNMDVIDIAFDKWRTVGFLEEHGLKSPKTFLTVAEAKHAIEKGELSFPLVLKPRWGSASIGIEFPEDIDELHLAYTLLRKRLDRSILKEASASDSERAILIQQKIPGKEFGMDVLNDLDGNYVATFVRQKLSMRSGETDKAISIVDERFEAVGKTIGNALGHIGNLDCDVFEHEGELYVLELNPRFGGGYPFSHEAGANTAAAYIEWLSGNHDVSAHLNYKGGLMFSKCDRLIAVSD